MVLCMDEETKLINILASTDSALCLSAFRRLVRIYKKIPENEIIYKYLEEFSYCPDESTVYLIECITEFVDNDSHLVRFSRSMNIYNRIIGKLIHLIKYESIQISLFVLLSRILHIKPCKDEWMEAVVDVFCTAKKSSVERMACKILISSISLNDKIDFISFKKVTSKIQMNNREQSDLFVMLNDLIYKNQRHTVDEYISFLRERDIMSLFRYSNMKFIQENIEEIDKEIEYISILYMEAIGESKEKRCAFLEHLFLLFSFSKAICKEFRRRRFVDILCAISEHEDATGYIAIKILDVILRNKDGYLVSLTE